MSKLVVSEFVTLDGVMDDPGDGDKTPHGGWSMSYWHNDIGKFKFDELLPAMPCSWAASPTRASQAPGRVRPTMPDSPTE